MDVFIDRYDSLRADFCLREVFARAIIAFMIWVVPPCSEPLGDKWIAAHSLTANKKAWHIFLTSRNLFFTKERQSVSEVGCLSESEGSGLLSGLGHNHPKNLFHGIWKCLTRSSEGEE
jgi:hypothetical protein